MKEIEANKKAWNLLAEEHYKVFKERLEKEHSLINGIITKELGDIRGKKLIHLQCNTGADTISLARMGANVTGIDLAPDNIKFANQLASDLDVKNARFIQSDILELDQVHNEKYDIVFTSEGAIGWLPDLKKWADTIRKLLKDDGFFYINEIHPFLMMFDEEKFGQNILDVKYPYFSKEADMGMHIGGYASKPKEAENYFWNYTISEIINALIQAGLSIEFLNEFDSLCYDFGNMVEIEKGLYQLPNSEKKFPLQFSIKATVRK